MDEEEKRRVIRDAATIVLLRQCKTGPQVLMGQRGSSAVFMPNKYVFPGGAVDKQDHHVTPAIPLNDHEITKLAMHSTLPMAHASAMAAIRELWEETGLMLGTQGETPDDVPKDWQGFYANGLAPRADVLKFIFRAVTPPGRPRRFDARFFIADAAAVAGDADDFSNASDELSHLHWIDLHKAKALDLPFITEVVLSEVIAITREPEKQRKIPFFNHDDERSYFSLL